MKRLTVTPTSDHPKGAKPTLSTWPRSEVTSIHRKDSPMSETNRRSQALGPWDELIGTLVEIGPNSITLKCTRRFEIELDGDVLGTLKSSLRLAEQVALIRLDDGTFRVRRVPSQPGQVVKGRR